MDDEEDIGDGKQIIDDSPQIFPYIDPDEINASSYIDSLDGENLSQGMSSSPNTRLLKNFQKEVKKNIGILNVQNKKHFSSSMELQELYKSSSGITKSNISNTRNWNEEFQQLMEVTYSNSERELERVTNLRKLCEEFAMIAAGIGKIIISELGVSNKTIPPITSKVGGIAGGEKYFSEGIFFKVPKDAYEIYGGDEGIIKSSGHELRGLMCLLDCRVSGLHFPLMVLCDYRGWRLLAESLLPLTKDTLVYGSGDSGASIHASSPEFNSKMETLGQLLNIKSEYVSNNSNTEKCLIHLSCDVEGHICSDNRMYLVDFARIFPPTQPRPNIKADFLISHFRPEFIKNYEVPLCSDSWSGFNLENKKQHNQEIKEATKVLLTKTIPQFSYWLENESKFQALDPKNPNSIPNLEDLISNIHRSGINIRYIGEIRRSITKENLKEYLLTEIIARNLKNEIHSEMRKIQSFQDLPYIKIIVDALNYFFGQNKEFYVNLVCSISRRYPNALSDEEKNFPSMLKNRCILLTLLLRLQNLLGFKFQNQLIESFRLEPSQLFNTSVQFSVDNITELFPIIKHIHRIFFEEGTALSKIAVSKSSDELFAQAAQRYQESLIRQPTDYRSLSNWGLSLFLQAQFKSKQGNRSKTEQSTINNLLQEAEKKFQEALSIEPRDYQTRIKLANCLSQRSLLLENSNSFEVSIQFLKQACYEYQQAYQLNPNNFEIAYGWGNTLLELAQQSQNSEDLFEACKKYKEAHHLNPQSFQVLLNWGVTLTKLARSTQSNNEIDILFSEAYAKYNMAVTLKSNDHEVYFNWANALYRHASIKPTNSVQYKDLLIKASGHYFHCLKLNPNYTQALNNWTRILISLTLTEEPEEEIIKTLSPLIQNYLSILRSLTLNSNSPWFPVVQFAQSENANPLQLIRILKELNYSNVPNENFSGRSKLDLESSNHLMRSQNLLVEMAEKLDQEEEIETVFPNPTLSESDFELIQIIKSSKSSFSTIYKARKRDFGTLYAIKTIRKAYVMHPDLKPLRHPFIIRLHFSFVSEKKIFFVFEYVSGGTLAQLTQIYKPFPEKASQFYAAELLSAIEGFHSFGIIYGNLSPDNVLITQEGHIKVIQKIEIKEEQVSEIVNIDHSYMAPELLEGREETKCMDFWSLGVIIYELLVGQTPFAASEISEVVDNILSGNIQYPNFLSSTCKNFLQNLLTIDVEKRLQFVKHIKADPFWDGIDWDDLESKELDPPHKPNTSAFRIPFILTEANMVNTVVMPNFDLDFKGRSFANSSYYNHNTTNNNNLSFMNNHLQSQSYH